MMARVSEPSHSRQKEFGPKKKLFSVNQGSNSHQYNYYANAQLIYQFMFHDNSYTSMIILSGSMVKHT